MSNAPKDQDGRKGQVSEIGGMDPADADTEISDDQSVAGSPTDGTVPGRGTRDSNTRAGSYRES